MLTGDPHTGWRRAGREPEAHGRARPANEHASTSQGGSAKAPAESRLSRWQRRLLDLSLHNRLLNFKPTRRSLRLISAEPRELVVRLFNGAQLKITAAPAPAENAAGAGGDGVPVARESGAALARQAMERGEILVDLDPAELAARLVELYRTARADIQEGGANTLYLVLGFLRWRRDDRDGRGFRAPLIVLPVSLQRTSVRSGLRMMLHDDEPRFNHTLLEMLRQDFDLDIRGLDDALPGDDGGIDLASVWDRVREEIADLDGFEINEDVVLGTFSFAKYLMWRDLEDRQDQLLANRVVRHLAETPRERFQSGVEFPEPRRLDQDFPVDALPVVLPADSSQLSAVAATSRGKDFVLIGPPGTGKSQTIANMIGENLAQGRSVLFVSEKIAALDVVYRRLRETGLSEFCLELHSSKSKKAGVLAQLRTAWNARQELDESEWRREAGRLGKMRRSLNAYVERAHHVHRNGLTPFDAMSRAVNPDDVAVAELWWPSANAHDEAALARLRDIAGRLDINAAQAVCTPGDGFDLVKHSTWSPAWQRELEDTTGRLGALAAEARRKASNLFAALRVENRSLGLERLRALKLLAAALAGANGRDLAFALGRGAMESLRRLDEGLALIREYRSLDRRDPEAQARRARIEARIHALEGPGRLVPGWRGLDSDASSLERDLHAARRLLFAVAHLGGDTRDMRVLHSAVRAVLAGDRPSLAAGAPLNRICIDLTRTLGELEQAAAEFSRLAGADVYHGVRADPGESWLRRLEQTCAGIVRRASRLNAWCAWRRVRGDALSAGLGPLVIALERGDLVAGEVARSFEVSYCRWWARAAVQQDPVLCAFLPAERDRLIQAFHQLDARFTELTRRYVRAKLCARSFAEEDGGDDAELGILRRELEKKSRHKAVRRLIAEMPAALTRLTPCLLMSPLSVAQYLDPEQAPFDLVIFDEASQITVWDAVGAIARGRQAVIVGDPRQLPPTSFFSRSDNQADDDAGVEGDLESILDECLGAGLPACRLNWHYRSDHESLIAFSNHRYYAGGLITFPSPLTYDRSVRLVHVSDGVYGRGGSRTNRAEAKALVSGIMQRLKDPAFVASGRSVGVVTFNVEQQRLIEDLLDEERLNDPSIERFFADELLEPLFVKNLESVQGDERDVMLFSVTYGPDADGHVSMNFGPMNREGGERRLNVAITRARSELLIFSTLRSEQIDLSRAPGEGVRDFKHFLEYAERGATALAESIYGSVGEYATPFESSVARALSERGWVVHPQIGVSAFRIGLGVVHPDAPSNYLAGLECDGSTYRRGVTARDRDKLRQQILERLGWRIVRIWVADWWLDPESAADSLNARLMALLEASRVEIEESAAAALLPGTGFEPDTNAVDVGETGTPVDERASSAATEDPGFGGEPARAPAPAATGGAYSVSDPAQAVDPVDPELFFESSSDEAVARMIDYVVSAEGPVRDDLLVKRIVRAHGFKRTGRRLRDRVLDLATPRYETTSDAGGSFFWPPGATPARWTAFRAPASEADFRSASEICIEELGVLARSVAAEGPEDPAREMALRMGLARIDSATRRRLEDVLSRKTGP